MFQYFYLKYQIYKLKKENKELKKFIEKIKSNKN